MKRRLAGGRFRVGLDPIAAGAMGFIYKGYDDWRQCPVAIKKLIHGTPEERYRLKQEFRLLARTSHRNLLEFFDLIDPLADAAPDPDDVEFGPFISMELIEGVDIATYVRRRGGLNDAGQLSSLGVRRLAECVEQLADGLACLHEAGKVHRDIKPRNLLIDEAGRLVIIDFGLSVEFDDPSKLTSIGGSPAYMSPEQVRGEAVTPASDWYSVGITLYEAICGECPKQSRLDAEQVQAAVGSQDHVPPEVATAIARLLHSRPEARGGAADMRRAFAIASGVSPKSADEQPPQHDVFVGRDVELAALQSAMQKVLEGKTTVATVSGTSGIGKSTLAIRALETDVARSFFVLTGACHQQESVPFKALDGVVDALSRLIPRLPPARLSEVQSLAAGALVRLFPVLQEALHQQPDMDSGEPSDIRRTGFEQLMGLFRVVAKVRPIAVWIDDLQWGDLDSAQLLHRMVAGGFRLFLLLTYRPIVTGRMPLLDSLQDHGFFEAADVRFELGPLPQQDVAALIRSILHDASSELTDVIVANSEGSPFFAREYARHARHLGPALAGAGSLRELLDLRLADLDPGAREVLELLSLTHGPCSRRVVERACDADNPARATFALLNTQLVASASAARDELIEVSHDRIRSAIAGPMDATRKRDCFRRLASSLSQESDPDPLLAFEFYSGYGDDVRAAQAAADAARRANRVLAFDQAIRLFGEALERDPQSTSRWQLLSELARAYAQVGRSKDAGDSALAAANLLRDQPQLHAEYIEQVTVASEQYLRGGHLDEGLATLERALKSVGLRLYRSPILALWAFAYHRMVRRIRRRRAVVKSQPIPNWMRARIDACWAAAAGLAWVYPMHSAAHQTQYLRLCLRSGDARRLVRALCTESVFLAGIYGERSLALSRASMLSAKKISDGLDDNVAHGLIKVCDTGAAFFRGRFSDAIPLGLDAGEYLQTACTGVSWEITNVNLFTMVSLAHLGKHAELQSRLPPIIDRATEQGDLLASCCLRSSYAQALRLLAQDDVNGLRASIDSAYNDWPGSGFEILDYYVACSEVRLLLYQNRIPEAWSRLSLTWRDFHRSQMAGFELVKAEIVYLRTRCALEYLRLADSGAPENLLIKSVRRGIRRLRSVRVQIARGWLAAVECEYDAVRAMRAPGVTDRVETQMLECGLELAAQLLRLRLGDSIDHQSPQLAGVADAAALARLV